MVKVDENIPKVGDKLVEEVLDGEEKVLYRAVHEVVKHEDASENLRLKKISQGDTASEGLSLKCTEEEFFDDDFKRMQQDDETEDDDNKPLKKEKGGGGDPVKTGLEVAKFAWEFIKDNKPVVNLETASTSVIAKGTSGLDYHSAKLGNSGVFQWRAYNWPIKEATAWDIKLELGG